MYQEVENWKQSKLEKEAKDLQKKLSKFYKLDELLNKLRKKNGTTKYQIMSERKSKNIFLIGYVVLMITMLIMSSCTQPEECTITESHCHDGELYWKE